MTAVKGKPVRFIAGKYGGKTGWVNILENANEEIVPFIVNLGRKGGKATFVYRSSVWLDGSEAAPNSYAWAALQQCPDIERSLVEVARKLAKCDIKRDAVGFQKVIQSKLNDAIVHQESKGSKAMYRKINFMN
jgi:hypothetical protein